MKIFSLLLFSEQETAGDKACSAVAVQDASNSADITTPESIGTGVNTPDAGETQIPQKSRREVYDEFIRANKEFFTEDTQKIISLRLKESKDMKESLKLADEQIKALRDELQAKQHEPQTPSADFMSAYPDFVLENELENETFKQLYDNGVSVNTAYNAAHFEELIEKAAQTARAEAVKATLDSIRAKGLRVRESASAFSSGLNAKRDVSRLSRSQRADIARRVTAGEDVIFS